MRLTNLALCAACAILACTRVALADTSVFINEIHYDDAGADLNEAVEVAAPAGTDLSGWQVVPYNGSGGTSYTPVVSLSGAPSANCGGYVLLNVSIANLQNGSPDGVALVDNNGVVIQFLSYEGTFTATNGPANGLTSVDIGVAESGSGTETDSLQLSGDGTVYGDFTWQADAAATFGACNNGQTFGTPPDIAPTVSTTTPANSATDVALNATIVIDFSEAVSVTPSAATMACNNSGSHSLALSGSGSSYNLDPAPDFSYGESCTVMIAASQVTDLDGTADPMAQNYSFSFSTVTGDVPPSVSNTAPASGTAGFPLAANLQITFSEPVTLDPGWYTLTCDNSGTHTATDSGAAAIYAINPDVDFAALEHCTWSIIANHVHDVDGNADAMTADVSITFDTSANSSDYYAGVDISSSAALEAWLHNRIKDHHAYPYSGSGTVTWTILHAADQDPMNPDNTVDVYKNESDAKTIDANTVNREHTWPNSYGFNDMTTVNGLPYPPYTDCHMLYLSNNPYNSDRANKPYGMCSGACTEKPTMLTNGFGGPGHSNFMSSSIWQTWDHRRGDVARAVLYMAVRYDGGTNAAGQQEPDLIVTDETALIHVSNKYEIQTTAYMGFKSVLLDWNDQDPPDAGERLRNEVVFSYQDNRNPFIDHPEWARCVFTGSNCPVPNDEIFKNGFEP